MAVNQIEHLIKVCENCSAEGKHLNPEGIAVIMRKIRRDMKRVGTNNDCAAGGV